MYLQSYTLILAQSRDIMLPTIYEIGLLNTMLSVYLVRWAFLSPVIVSFAFNSQLYLTLLITNCNLCIQLYLLINTIY